MKLSKWVLLFFILVMTMSLVSFKPAQSSELCLDPVGYHDTEATILAAYQVWFGLDSHRPAFAGEPMLPNEWPYDSSSMEVISRHIQEAKERGIDGFVVDWYGPNAGLENDVDREYQDLAAAELFRQAEEVQGFYVSLLYDEGALREAGLEKSEYQDQVIADLQYADEHYFDSPVYLKINERPALFIFPYGEFDSELEWAVIKAHLRPVTLINMVSNPDDPGCDSVFDGFFAWVTATDGQWDPEGQEWGQGYLERFYATMMSPTCEGKVAIGGVWPGFDDSLAPWRQNRYISRRGTLTHDQTLALAESNNVDFIMIATWNDFEEGTDIEYGVRMVVDMEKVVEVDNVEKPDPEMLIRSSPVKVCWNPGSGEVKDTLQVYTCHELIYSQQHDPGVWLSLIPGTIYELKVWKYGSSVPLTKFVKIRRIDPVPDVDPVEIKHKSITVISPNGGENLEVGSTHDIAWTSEGLVGNVMIEYSTNGGVSWKIIGRSTENDGTFNWLVPGFPSDNCLVRIREKDMDCGSTDVSDGLFSIGSPVSGDLTIRSPNGGETWSAGTTREIEWNINGPFESANINYSTDNGTTWKEIVRITPNDGSYDWTVPYTPSHECLVRVASIDSSGDSGPSDVSDAVFSIVLPAAPTIQVTFPNGGERLTVDSRYTVTWESFGFRDDVKIEYSTNGGDSWNEITPAAANDGRYDWLVPDDSSELCLVRVSGAEGEPSDESDQVFTIISQSQSDLRVLTPNGGEIWEVGSVHPVEWTGGGDINNVNIKYSKDNGVTWKGIVQSTANTGSYEWIVPATVSDECLLRVTANDGNEEPIPSDVSDAVFSIVLPGQPVLRVISPNGGEQLPIGSRYTITWYGTGTREDVKIEYSTDAGDAWTVIAEKIPNNGKYDWVVPGTQSEICLVRISEVDGDPVDVSDKVFSIVPPLSEDIVVSYPNGGESWTAGNVKEISWYGSAEINNVTIKYSHNNGITWQTVVQTTPNDGSYDWTIPDTPSDECLVQISANDGDPDPVPSDMSDAVFSILKSTAGEFKVTSPNGGESWEVGSIHPVTWTGSGDIGSIMIEYSHDNGVTWSTVAAAASNTGTYDWPIPDTVSARCLLRITANDGGGDPKPSDVSDEVFSIVHPSSPTIRVITPNGGEEAVIGLLYHITWFSTGFREPVKIEYSTTGGDSWQPIVDETENDGEYDWTVPDEPSEICLLRISETSGQPVDVSDTVFSIVSQLPGDLTVLTPNGGENLETGSGYNITWTCSGLNNVAIEYSTGSKESWLYIARVPADDGSYTWTVPATPSEDCLVRISGADSDENPVDVSDEVFTIYDPAQAFIEVMTPNGGESVTVGGEYYITWQSAGIADVLIEYTPNNGEQWIPIDTVPAKGGRYTWIVPDDPSAECLIRIGAVSSGEPLDISDALFTITPD